MNEKTAVKYFTVVLLSLFLCVFCAEASAVDCGADAIRKEYYEKYHKCDEFREIAAQLAHECLEEYKTGNLLAVMCLECGLIEEAAPFLNKLRETYNSDKQYNYAFELECLANDDEECYLKQILLIKRGKEDSTEEKDRIRSLAWAYLYYGDFNKAIALLTGILEQDEGFLRAANDLAFVYRDAGEFDKAQYYAEYYLERDESWSGIYRTLAMVEYYRDKMPRAWKQMEQAEKLDTSSNSKWLRAIMSLRKRDFAEAKYAFKNFINNTPHVDLFRSNAVRLKYARLYLELYEKNRKMIPDKATLEKQARTESDNNDNLAAALHYLMLFDIYNQSSYLNEASYHFELNGNMYEAVKYALIYLSLEPDSPDRDYIERFLESRVVRE